jgi:hypothetical protein
MKQFEFRQSSSQQNSVPVLPSYEHRNLIQLYHGTTIACALRVEAEVKRAHILHRNCDMQMNLPLEWRPHFR